MRYIGTDPLENAETVLDAQGNYLLPGFIDLHCHGGNGFDFMDATPEEMAEIADIYIGAGHTLNEIEL